MGYACSCLDLERCREAEKCSNGPSNRDGRGSLDTAVRDGNDWEWPWQSGDAHKIRNACCYHASFRRENCRRNKSSHRAGGRGIGCRDRAYHLHDDIPCVDAEEEEGTVRNGDSTEQDQ